MTVAIRATSEDSNATGINEDQADNSHPTSGAVYVFSRDPRGEWVQAAYVKAPNGDPSDYFGSSLALSAEGHILAAGAYNEASAATGVGGNQTQNILPSAGAVYLY